MNGKTGMTLILAILSGLGAMYGAQKLIAKRDTPPELRDVVVASRELKVEEVLKEDMLKVVKMKKDQVPANAYTAPTEVAGRWVQIKMLEGEAVVEPKLAPKDLPPGLIGRIPPGMRALAIEVNEQSGVSGFILPDHRVDVIQARTDGPRRPDEQGAETILQNVQVLAAGQVTSRPEDKSIQVRTVTLAVTPEQVENLVAARSRGPLSLSLRSINDTTVVERKKPEVIEEPKPEPPPVVVEAKPEPEPEPEPEPLPLLPPPPRPRYTLIYRGFAPPERVRRISEPAFGEVDAVAGLGLPRPLESAE